MKKVICTRTGRCEMCNAPSDNYPLVRGRAYTVTHEREWGAGNVIYKLKEIPAPPHMWICAPHFTEITPSTDDIFALADKPVTMPASKTGIPCTPVQGSYKKREKVR